MIKQMLLLPFLLFFITNTLFGQPTSSVRLEMKTLLDVIRFDGITFSGDRVFGIYPTRSQAEETIKKYMTRYHNSLHQLTYKKVYAGTIEIQRDEQVFKRFKELCPKGYKKITKEAYNALQIVSEDNQEAALWYFMKTNKKSLEDAKKEIIDLTSNYKKYVIQ